MPDVSEHRFSFALGDLPRGTFVKLSDALNLAFYGGVPSIRYEGAIPLCAVEDGGLSMGEDEWMLNTDDRPIQGPKLVNVARPGASCSVSKTVRNRIRLSSQKTNKQSWLLRLLLANTGPMPASRSGRLSWSGVTVCFAAS